MYEEKKIIKQSNIRRHRIWIEQCYVYGERKYLIRAEGKHYTIWKRIKDDKEYAKEIFLRYKFFIWVIDLFNWHPFTSFICRIIHRII